MLILLSGRFANPHTAPVAAYSGATSEGDLYGSTTQPPACNGLIAADVAATSKPGCAKCLIAPSRNLSNSCPNAAPNSLPSHFTTGNSASSSSWSSDKTGDPVPARTTTLV